MRSESFENSVITSISFSFVIRVQTTLLVLQILKIWTGSINASTTFRDKKVAIP